MKNSTLMKALLTGPWAFAITDAFARHAGLKEAEKLRNHLEMYLLERIDEVRVLAYEDMTLLTGASGILAVLLMRQGGQRSWLSYIALRCAQKLDVQDYWDMLKDLHQNKECLKYFVIEREVIHFC